MADSTGLQFTVKVGALPESTFVVAEFALDEGFNRPFNLRLELASAQPDIDFGAVLDQPCELLVVQRRAAAPGCAGWSVTSRRVTAVFAGPLSAAGTAGVVASVASPELPHLPGAEAR